MKNKTIGIIGLGYVGLPLAVEFGKKRAVVGYDINADRIAQLNDGYDLTKECSKEQLLAATKLQFSSEETSLDECSVFIVTVPTPVDAANQPDMSPLRSACKVVGRHLRGGAVIIFESTVYPGATEEVAVPILEFESGLKAIFSDQEQDFTSGFFVGYSPERINPGDKTHRVTDIIKVTSGSTPEAASAIDSMYADIINAGTYRASSIKVAEAAKVIENTQRDLNIAFVNELSMIFSKMNINTQEVLEAAATKWNFLQFRPGLVGGHCIGVDPYYLKYKANVLGFHASLISAGRRINDQMATHMAHRVLKAMSRIGLEFSKTRVSVLGVTFKPDCPDIRNTKVFDLVNELASWGVGVLVGDPLADANEVQKVYGFQLTEISELWDADVVIYAVGHEFLINNNHVSHSSHKLIVDLTGRIKIDVIDSGVEVITF